MIIVHVIKVVFHILRLYNTLCIRHLGILVYYYNLFQCDISSVVTSAISMVTDKRDLFTVRWANRLSSWWAGQCWRGRNTKPTRREENNLADRSQKLNSSKRRRRYNNNINGRQTTTSTVIDHVNHDVYVL